MQKGMNYEIPFIFPELLVHSTMAIVADKMLRLSFNEKNIISIRPVSAGFLSSIGIEKNCYGRSESLELHSRPEDNQLISMCDYGSMVKC